MTLNILNSTTVYEDFLNLTPGEVTKFKQVKIISSHVDWYFSKHNSHEN